MNYANANREIGAGLEHRCTFCREPLPESHEEVDKRRMNRIKKNDPVALNEMGKKRRSEGDYESAFEYSTKAAALGNADAHFRLSIMYYIGEGVDEEKEMYHEEQAAIGGHIDARYNLGLEEGWIYSKVNNEPAWTTVNQVSLIC